MPEQREFRETIARFACVHRPDTGRRFAALWYALSMKSAMKSLPNPRDLAREFANPFIYVLGGFALFLSVIYLIVGQDPTVPVTIFLSRSAEALLPLAQSLIALWLCYLVVYLLLSAFVFDLWVVSRAPAWVTEHLRRILFSCYRRFPSSSYFPSLWSVYIVHTCLSRR